MSYRRLKVVKITVFSRFSACTLKILTSFDGCHSFTTDFDQTFSLHTSNINVSYKFSLQTQITRVVKSELYSSLRDSDYSQFLQKLFHTSPNKLLTSQKTSSRSLQFEEGYSLLNSVRILIGASVYRSTDRLYF